MLTDSIKNKIKEFALETPNVEICGLLLKNENVIKCKNYSSIDPEEQDNETNSFTLLIKESIDKNNILAIWHSHPANGNVGFSKTDTLVSEKLQKDFILYCIKDDSFHHYRPIKMEIPLEGRPFVIGIFDCATLGLDYYKYKLNINIPDIILDDRYWTPLTIKNLNNENIKNLPNIKNHLLNNGFIEVYDMKKHDVLVLNANLGNNITFPWTIYIYLGDNLILHHPRGEASKISCLLDRKKRKINCILRHKLML